VKFNLLKTLVMVVFILLSISTPLVRADDDKPPPCKPEQHDCRCDPGHNPHCTPPCTSDHDGCCDPDAVGNDDDDCKCPKDDDGKCKPVKPPPAMIHICYVGDVKLDEFLIFDRNPWVDPVIKPSDYHSYTGRLGLYVMGPSDKCPRSKGLLPFIRYASDSKMAGGNPK
jgi:hypothetical protein